LEDTRQAHIRELIEARNAVERQINILVGGRPYYGFKRQRQIADVLKRLRDTLAELEDCISAEHDADRPSRR
jgi:hypothetical protein